MLTNVLHFIIFPDGWWSGWEVEYQFGIRWKREKLLQNMTNEDFLALEKQVHKTWQNQLNSQSAICS